MGVPCRCSSPAIRYVRDRGNNRESRERPARKDNGLYYAWESVAAEDCAAFLSENVGAADQERTKNQNQKRAGTAMKVVLVNPNSQAEVYQDLSENLTAIAPPIWCRLIKSYLRNKGIPAVIVDAGAFGTSPENTAEIVADICKGESSLVVVVVHGHNPSATTQTMPSAIATCKAIRDHVPQVPLLALGGHVAALPQGSLVETGADFVCTGEGPVTVCELALCLESHGRIEDVHGIGYSGDGIYAQNPPAPNVWDLTEMPGGCWDVLPMQIYRAHNHHAWTNDFERKPYATIYTSLGCPHNCLFCQIQTPFRQGDLLKHSGKIANSYRLWPTDLIMEEIVNLVETYGVTNIRIDDEMFLLNKNHVESICKAVTERYGDSLNFWAYTRIDTVRDEKLLDTMRAAGVKWLCPGIESESNDVRDGIDKGQYGRADIIKACNMMRDHGINILANFIFGLPTDTVESMERTFQLGLEIMPEFWNGYSCMALPGSALYRDHPYDGAEGGWLSYAQYSKWTKPMPTETLTPAQVLRFRDTAARRFFSDQSYQAMVVKKFGPRALDEVKHIAGHKIERSLLS